jgi:hypothetical protein
MYYFHVPKNRRDHFRSVYIINVEEGWYNVDAKIVGGYLYILSDSGKRWIRYRNK